MIALSQWEAADRQARGRPGPELRAADLATVRTVAELAVVLRAIRRREARRRGGPVLTYRQLAGLGGWSRGLIADYLAGKVLPPTDRFDTLVELLGASPAERGALATVRDRVADLRRPARGNHPGSPPADPRPGPGPDPERPDAVPEARLAALDRLLAAAPPGAVVVVAGGPGASRAALVRGWAHRVRSRFPDGLLDAHLAGRGGDPVPSGQALGGLLGALGVPPAAVPAAVPEAAALYRSLLADRRALVLLAEAGSAEQVRPLLPAGAGCLTLVTSGDRLDGLVAREGAWRLVLAGGE